MTAINMKYYYSDQGMSGSYEQFTFYMTIADSARQGLLTEQRTIYIGTPATAPFSYTTFAAAQTDFLATMPAQFISDYNSIFGGTDTAGQVLLFNQSLNDALYTQPDYNQTNTAAIDFIKNKPSINTTRTTSSFTPTLVSTGATGTQVSTTKDSTIRGTFTTSTTVTLGGSPSSVVTAKICATNNATEANWTTVGLTGGSQPTTLAITVNQQISSTGQICFDVPTGWFYKFENTGSGTHSETVVSGQQTIYG